MSSTLYALGRWCHRHATRVVILWLGALLAFGGLALALRGALDDTFSIPDSSSHEALLKLRSTFPEASGISALAIIVPPEGQLVTDPAQRPVIEQGVLSFERVPGVSGAVSPWNEHFEGLVAPGGRAAIIQVRLSLEQIHQDDLQPLVDAAAALQSQLPAGTTVTMGGEAFSIELPELSIIEAIGVGVALVVLAIVLGSLMAATIPIVTALIGVGLAMSLLMLTANVTTINSVTPMLAIMLGLAVGIDYALFILSRHRDQLRDPSLSTEESAARAVATAGSAVVFAGVTVVIALLGLALARIPFLTVMGGFAALGVGLAVAIALTLLPAAMGWAGDRLRPRASRGTGAPSAQTPGGQPPQDATRPGPAAPTRTSGRFYRAWVKAAIRWPWVTVIVVVLACGALSVPAKDLRLSLPNSGQHAATASDRIAYDQAARYFGVGFNGPLVVTVDLLSSRDPLGVMAGIKDDIAATPGVQSVLIATPNRNADTGFVQVIPATAPDEVATQHLVRALRDKASGWLTRYGTATEVTGITAIQIDVSERLAHALVPFGAFVVGLSLVLLTLVFKSIAVPLKAALGYLLSIGVAFGATTLVFNHGWLRAVVNLEKPIAVVSFLPILLMGILFGLAMDYEVFLVSRIREEYVHGLSARDAIVEGFTASGKVVAAAAAIMIAVFAFFVPEGMGPIKAIAFALAVGIAVDAFVVRMTLVPAVLALLGDKAWWLPRWLARMLPSLDVEGETLAKELELRDWPGDGSVLHAEGIGVQGVLDCLDLCLHPGQTHTLTGETARTAALLALTGRLRITSGRARIAGSLLPEQAAKVRLASAFIDATQSASVADELGHALSREPQLVVVDNADLLVTAADRAAVRDLVATAAATGRTVILGAATDRVPALSHPGSDHVAN